MQKKKKNADIPALLSVGLPIFVYSTWSTFCFELSEKSGAAAAQTVQHLWYISPVGAFFFFLI